MAPGRSPWVTHLSASPVLPLLFTFLESSGRGRQASRTAMPSWNRSTGESQQGACTLLLKKEGVEGHHLDPREDSWRKLLPSLRCLTGVLSPIILLTCESDNMQLAHLISNTYSWPCQFGQHWPQAEAVTFFSQFSIFSAWLRGWDPLSTADSSTGPGRKDWDQRRPLPRLPDRVHNA